MASHRIDQQQGEAMTLAPIDPTPTAPVIDRFTVVAASIGPDPLSQPVRSAYVEDAWLPYLGPCALLFARRLDHMLANLQDGHQSVSVLVHRWASDLGVYPEEVLAAKNRLLRFGLATWEAKGNQFALLRHWPPVPAAIATPEHRALLVGLADLPMIPPGEDES
jgi:hypothetical protein